MLEAVREGAKLSEEFVLRGFISPQEIRVVEVKRVVDTGATPLGVPAPSRVLGRGGASARFKMIK